MVYSANQQLEGSDPETSNSARKKLGIRRQSYSSNKIALRRKSTARKQREDGLSEDEVKQVSRIKSILSSLRDEGSEKQSNGGLITPIKNHDIISETSREDSDNHESKSALRYVKQPSPLDHLQEIVR